MRAAFACATSLVALAAGTACRRPTAPIAPSAPASTEAQRVRALVCADIGEDACLEACAASPEPAEHAECVLSLRFASDPEARELAIALYRDSNVLVGPHPGGAIDGYARAEVTLFPALPIGERRHHLSWLRASLAAFERFFESLAPHATRAITFQPRPRGFMFFRTADRSYPSAYHWDGVIGYNVLGPLHGDPRDVHETLFHELFHFNDDARGTWSTANLRPVFESIIARCGDDHECLAPFAPYDTVVPSGTYYPFDPRTRDVREYAAELALRYFLEHEAIFAGEAARFPPFKCMTPENRLAWDRVVEEFFGGADLVPECEHGGSS
jgi:hypothetical protein